MVGIGVVVGCVVCVVGGMGPVVVVSGLVPAGKLLSLFGVLHRLTFERIEFEMIYIFLQLVVFLLQLLHQFIVLLNFPAFIFQPVDSFERTKLLQMLTV